MSKRTFRLFVLILGILIALGPVAIDMYLPAFPAIAADLRAPLARVEASLAAFFLGLATGQLIYGTLSDRFGRKLPLYAGLGIYVAASLACAQATHIDALIALRFCQALGACAGMVTARAMVRDLFAPQDAARVFSVLMLVMGAAPILAPLAGGYLTAAAGWKAVFWVAAAAGAMGGLLAWCALPETKAPDPRVRLGRSLVTYGQILVDPTFLQHAAVGGLAQAGLFAYITGSPFMFIEYFAVPAERYGWIFGANAFGLIAMSQVNARLLRTVAAERLLQAAVAVMAVAAVALLAAGQLALGFWAIVVPLFLYIASLGAIAPLSTAAALAEQGERAGAASALIGTTQFALAFLTSSIISASAAASPRPLTALMGGCGLLSLLSFLVAKRVRRSS